MLCERGDDGAVRVVLGEFGLAAKVLFEKLSEARKLTTFYLAKNYHRWVTFISLKTIKSDLQQGPMLTLRQNPRRVHSLSNTQTKKHVL